MPREKKNLQTNGINYRTSELDSIAKNSTKGVLDVYFPEVQNIKVAWIAEVTSTICWLANWASELGDFAQGPIACDVIQHNMFKRTEWFNGQTELGKCKGCFHYVC